jgi:hypothetical protein
VLGVLHLPITGRSRTIFVLPIYDPADRKESSVDPFASLSHTPQDMPEASRSPISTNSCHSMYSSRLNDPRLDAYTWLVAARPANLTVADRHHRRRTKSK